MSLNLESQTSPPAAIPRWMVFTVLAIAVLARDGVFVAMASHLEEDRDGYRQLAENLVNTGTYGWSAGEPTAHRPPLYPLVLKKCFDGTGQFSIWRVGLLHVALGVATVWLTIDVGRRWRLGRWSVAAGLLVAVDPILLYWSTFVMTETLATFLAVLGLWCLTKFSEKRTWWEAGLVGGCLALAALCRPTFLVWLALCGLAVLLARTTRWRRISNVLSYAAAAAIIITPWVVRNYNTFGQPIIATTHGGYTLLLGNNPWFYDYLQRRDRSLAWDPSTEPPPDPGQFLEGPERISSDDWNRWNSFILLGAYARQDFIGPPNEVPELFFDKEAWKAGTSAMRSDPRGALRASFYRLRSLWGVLPQRVSPNESRPQQLTRYAVALFYTAELLLFLVGLWVIGRRLFRSPWLWGTLICLAFTAVHTLYWTDLRMRAPLVPVIGLAVSVAMGWLAAGKAGRKSFRDKVLDA